VGDGFIFFSVFVYAIVIICTFILFYNVRSEPNRPSVISILGGKTYSRYCRFVIVVWIFAAILTSVFFIADIMDFASPDNEVFRQINNPLLTGHPSVDFLAFSFFIRFAASLLSLFLCLFLIFVFTGALFGEKLLSRFNRRLITLFCFILCAVFLIAGEIGQSKARVDVRNTVVSYLKPKLQNNLSVIVNYSDGVIVSIKYSDDFKNFSVVVADTWYSVSDVHKRSFVSTTEKAIRVAVDHYEIPFDNGYSVDFYDKTGYRVVNRRLFGDDEYR